MDIGGFPNQVWSDVAHHLEVREQIRASCECYAWELGRLIQSLQRVQEQLYCLHTFTDCPRCQLENMIQSVQHARRQVLAALVKMDEIDCVYALKEKDQLYWGDVPDEE